MKIASFSDSHGQIYLPVVEDDTDIICIAGDIIPLNVQSSDEYSHIWFVDEFLRWAKELNPNVKKIFLVAGNHDKYFEHIGAESIKGIIAKEGLSDKVIYLEDETYIYEGYKITGSPWVKNLPRWSFNSDNLTESFSFIEDCDILITHIPPMVDKVGCSYPYQAYERNFGSIELTKVFEDKNIKVNICGHVHTGIHNGVPYGNTMIYNVSMINESYYESYPVTYFEI